jgi:hypothetical protein
MRNLYWFDFPKYYCFHHHQQQPFWIKTGHLMYHNEQPIFLLQARGSLRNGNEQEAEGFSQKSLVLILITLLTLPILFITALVT